MEPADVARQYRRLARLHHPDRGGDPRTMARINDLYEQLRCQGAPAPIVGRGNSGPR
jgi:curved DNA-binding protein CbpA